MLIVCPRDFLNAAVTGLAGDYLLPQKFTVGTGDNKQTFRARETLHWEVRWDHDERHGRGPHVNAQFGTRPLSKFAYYLHESKYIQIPPEIPAEWKKATSNQMFQRLSNKVKYPMNHNAGKTTPAFRKRAIMPNNDIDPVINEQCRLDTINVLKEYFKAVATGTLVYRGRYLGQGRKVFLSSSTTRTEIVSSTYPSIMPPASIWRYSCCYPQQLRHRLFH